MPRLRYTKTPAGRGLIIDGTVTRKDLCETVVHLTDTVRSQQEQIRELKAENRTLPGRIALQYLRETGT